MRFLQPVTEANASPKTQDIYRAIRQRLHASFTPLVFQLVANYEDYLVYLWNQIDVNLESDAFAALSTAISHYTETTTLHWISLNPTLEAFCARLTPSELERLRKTVAELTSLNATLTLVTIAVRESLKGIPVGVLKLVDKTSIEAAHFSHVAYEPGQSYGLVAPATGEISPATSLLAPLIGNLPAGKAGQQLAISQYAQFFTIVAGFMDQLVKTETYLRHRVILEELVLRLVPQIPQPIQINYKQFMEFTQDSPQAPHLQELLFLLYDLFPSKFPHLALTSGVMHNALLPVGSSLSTT